MSSPEEALKGLFEAVDREQLQTVPEGYEPLRRVLDEALRQAALGKGKERHAGGRPFLRQPIMEQGRIFGPGGPGQQVAKKTGEAMGMLRRQEFGAAKAEILGAINYAAAMVLLIEELEQEAKVPVPAEPKAAPRPALSPCLDYEVHPVFCSTIP